MNEGQRLLKYAASVFAVLLMIGLVLGVVDVAAELFGFDLGFTGQHIAAGSNERGSDLAETGFTSIDAELNAADLTVTAGDKAALTYDKRYVTATVRGGKLQLRDRARMTRDRVSIHLTVPRDLIFADVSVEIGAGTLNADVLQCDALDLSIGAGNADIGSLIVRESADIEYGAGNLTVGGGSVANLDLDGGAGNLRFTGRLTGSCDVNTGLGKTELHLDGPAADYTLRFSKGMGTVRLNGENIRTDKETGSGGNVVDIANGLGETLIFTNAAESAADAA